MHISFYRTSPVDAYQISYANYSLNRSFTNSCAKSAVLPRAESVPLVPAKSVSILRQPPTRYNL